jgi:hypothetical protein
LAGFQIEDYIYFERIILKKLDWKLEISDSAYQRLVKIGKNEDVKGYNIENRLCAPLFKFEEKRANNKKFINYSQLNGYE